MVCNSFEIDVVSDLCFREDDIKRYRELRNQMDIMISGYKKMEERLESYQNANAELLIERR